MTLTNMPGMRRGESDSKFELLSFWQLMCLLAPRNSQILIFNNKADTENSFIFYKGENCTVGHTDAKEIEHRLMERGGSVSQGRRYAHLCGSFAFSS